MQIISRSDRQFFKTQYTIRKEGLFDKIMPAWASDMNLIANVVKLHYNEVRRSYFQRRPQEMSRLNGVNRPHPITFSWSRWDELMESDGGDLKEKQQQRKQRRLE